MSKSIYMEIPDELLEFLGSEDEAGKEAKQSLVLDLVRRGRISRSKAAEMQVFPCRKIMVCLGGFEPPTFRSGV